MGINVEHTKIDKLEGNVRINISEEFAISKITQEAFNEELEEAYQKLQAVIKKYKI